MHLVYVPRTSIESLTLVFSFWIQPRSCLKFLAPDASITVFRLQIRRGVHTCLFALSVSPSIAQTHAIRAPLRELETRCWGPVIAKLRCNHWPITAHVTLEFLHHCTRNQCARGRVSFFCPTGPEGGVKIMGRRTYFEETHIFTGGLTSTLPI